MPASQDVTQMLVEWRNGDRGALNRLMPIVYDELRRLAHRYMKRQPQGHTLQTSALVNEAYIRLAGQRNVDWQNRAHFFAIAARIMRSLLIDHLRSRNFAKRGGGARRVSLDEVALISDERSEELLALDEALTRLSAIDERKGRIVELRYFSGLSVEETAEVLGLSPITIKREWLKAKSWLYRELSPEECYES
jgi:RNA polymerase sigma factor (TIGR02999 family)